MTVLIHVNARQADLVLGYSKEDGGKVLAGDEPIAVSWPGKLGRCLSEIRECVMKLLWRGSVRVILGTLVGK